MAKIYDASARVRTEEKAIAIDGKLYPVDDTYNTFKKVRKALAETEPEPLTVLELVLGKAALKEINETAPLTVSGATELLNIVITMVRGEEVEAGKPAETF